MIQFYRAWGCEITVFPHDIEKQDSLLAMGVTQVLNSYDEMAVLEQVNSFDFILVTVNKLLDWANYLACLKPKGRLHFVGLPLESIEIGVLPLVSKQRCISGFQSGSPAAIENMLSFVVEHHIQPSIERFHHSQIKDAIKRSREGSVRYRVVVNFTDYQTLLKNGCGVLKANLITREGYEQLKKELNQLWREERPDVTKKVTWAASLGDRSENADYQYNKKRLREIDRRVRYLTKRIESIKVVDYSPEQEGQVFFGAWVIIENETGAQKRFRIVGGDEIFFGIKTYISIDSPMARALLKKTVDDDVIVQTPEGVAEWFIVSIIYGSE